MGFFEGLLSDGDYWRLTWHLLAEDIDGISQATKEEREILVNRLRRQRDELHRHLLSLERREQRYRTRIGNDQWEQRAKNLANLHFFNEVVQEVDPEELGQPEEEHYRREWARCLYELKKGVALFRRDLDIRESLLQQLSDLRT